MEKFALLNLLKALDGLSSENPAGENATAGQNFNAAEGFGADASNPLGGILGNLLSGGLFGGPSSSQPNASAGNNSTQNNGDANHGASPLYDPPHNVMASVLERHESMSNRLKNKK